MNGWYTFVACYENTQSRFLPLDRLRRSSYIVQRKIRTTVRATTFGWQTPLGRLRSSSYIVQRKIRTTVRATNLGQVSLLVRLKCPSYRIWTKNWTTVRATTNSSDFLFGRLRPCGIVLQKNVADFKVVSETRKSLGAPIRWVCFLPWSMQLTMEPADDPVPPRIPAS